MPEGRVKFLIKPKDIFLKLKPDQKYTKTNYGRYQNFAFT